MIELYDKERVD